MSAAALLARCKALANVVRLQPPLWPRAEISLDTIGLSPL